MAKTTYNICLFEEYHWWVAQALEVDVATQGGTPAEALENIKEALALHFESPSASVMPCAAARPGCQTVQVTVDV